MSCRTFSYPVRGFAGTCMTLLTRNASPRGLATLNPQSTCHGPRPGPKLARGVRAGSLRATVPRAREKTRGRKRKKCRSAKYIYMTTGYFAGQSTAVVEILQSSAPYFLIFVLRLVVCSPLLLLSGRTTGCFAGQSTAVVEILQSSAPGVVMVMMMVGNAAVAATATAANTQNSGAHEYDSLLCWPVYCCC